MSNYTVNCEACDAGYRLADDGIHYDARDATWGVCRKVVAILRGEADPDDSVFGAIAQRSKERHERFLRMANHLGESPKG